MTIDLKWTLPAVLPFALLFLARSLAWAGGADWSGSDELVAFCLFIGLFMGGLSVTIMCAEGIRWNVTIGRGQK